MKLIAVPRPRAKTARTTRATGAGLTVAVVLTVWLGNAAAASAQAAPTPTGTSSDMAPQADTGSQPAPAPQSDTGSQHDSGSQLDLFSKDTLTLLFDARLFVANGSTSFVNGGLGKTRFQGDANGNFTAGAAPFEADVVWTPHFTNSLSASVSAAWQRDQEHPVDLLEAFLNYLPTQKGPIGISARAGLMWPEISLEHSTGGAWSVVNTITPSAINSWVGEEVKVVGGEATLHVSLGQHELAATGAVFGFNDTSGTLLSFRGWALQDEKATAFGHFPLPTLNPFIRLLQQNETKSTIEIDHKAGYYGRLDWRPPWPFGVALFYYDNEGNPQAFTSQGQWGWRTRFWNLGINADLGPNTKLLAQAMTGSTQMGFSENGVTWVDTSFKSAYLLVTQRVSPTVAVTGRIEQFSTREHGSEMPADNSEDGWAMTAAIRMKLTNHLTGLLEAMNVRSSRGTRVELLGLSSSFEAQTVFQAAIRFKY